jgi:glycosyltransferase involved in cell wall biosynthesis
LALEQEKHCINVGLFGGIKQRGRSDFDYEAQVIYDLTYVVVPEMHHRDTVVHHGGSIEHDALTNDLSICISEWTRKDLVDYVGVDGNKCMVSHLGFDTADAEPREDIEPYYLMLGTIEPRKNHALVLRAVRDRPEWLQGRKLVIAGRTGWGVSLDSMIDRFELNDRIGRDIYYFGFCSDRMRARLLRNARALLYPSLYEGFGLPVIEAMAVGTPVITSRCTSLPEAGGDAAFYIDPTSTGDLVSAVSSLEATLADPAAVSALRERMSQHVARFSWNGFCSSIVSRIERDLSAWRCPAPAGGLSESKP